MKLMLLVAGFALSLILALVMHGVPVGATLAPGVRIMLVQTGGVSATHERIDIENQSDQAVDLTGWKLAYRSAASTATTATQLTKFTAGDGWHVLLDAGKRESIVSNELIAATPLDATLALAERFAGGMSATGGGVQLVAADGTVVDMVGWGTANELARLGLAAPAMSGTTWLVRQGTTGDNKMDFALETQDIVRRPFVVGSLYDVQDVCINIADIQLAPPNGYMADNGTCQPVDVCSNIEGIQTAMPSGRELAVDGSCQAIDVCRNIDGVQADVPIGYDVTGERECAPQIMIRKLLITEVLPNPSGSDEGSEFIELYNADTEPIALKDYKLMVGKAAASLPADRVLQPGEFLTLSDTDLGRNLPNTTGVSIWLTTIRNVEVMQMPAYMNAKDDSSWALGEGGEWAYTFAPTPGEPNIALTALPCAVGYERDPASERCHKVEVAAAVAATTCRDGQYRSEETGRCRNVLSAAAVLAPCKEGQYRSEATNRCRSIAALASSVKPCADDQFRNPMTNRCKSIASSDDVALADCGEGRERNPTTNRCRNVATAAASAMAFKVEPIKDTAQAFVGWWALGGVGVLALGYGVWEWRSEITRLLRRATGWALRR